MKPRTFKYIFFIVIVILIILALFILYANKSEGTVIAEKKRIDNIISNNLTFGIVNYDNLNPHISQNQDVQYISKLIYQELIGINENFELVSGLAEEWSKISDKTYIIKLNKDKYWHSGEKFTAKDVEFTIDELKSELSNSIYKDNVKNIEKVEIIDDYTVKIYTYEEEEFFEYNLCMPILYYNSLNGIIGTGNYRVCEITDETIVLEETNVENIPRKIKINLYSSYSELYSAFSQEKLDIITTSNINFNNFVGTIDLKEEKIKGRELIFLKINTSKDINIRKAINCAINKDEIIYNVFNNKYYCTDNPFNNGNYLIQGNNEDSYNLNSARRYLANLDLKIQKGDTLNLDLSIKQNNEIHTRIAQELKKQLEKIGLKINIEELPVDVYNYKIEKSDYEIILCEDILPIYPAIKEYLNTDNVEVKELLEQVAYIKDKDSLKNIYKKILEQYEKENSIICLSLNSVVILHDSNVKGNFKGNWYNIFYNIDTWYKEL